MILSIFPGIDLLGRAFEEVWPEACIVRGPDLIFGGDIHAFHPPAGKFDGVIGGPPCQAFSALRHLVAHVHGPDAVAPNLIPEFERVVAEAVPAWFVMENVPKAPEPLVPGYVVMGELIRDVWVGGETSRQRRFCFGTREGIRLQIEQLALHCPNPETAVLCDARQIPVAVGGSGKRKPIADGTRRSPGHGKIMPVSEMCRLQGLPPDFADGLPITSAGKRKAIGNGVPLAMGRAVAKAVKLAMCPAAEEVVP